MTYTRYHTVWHDKEVAQDSDLGAAFFQGVEDSLVTVDSDVLVIDPAANRVTVAAGSPTLPNATAWTRNQSLRVARNLDGAGSASAGSANEFGAQIQVGVNGATSSATAYEKVGLLVSSRTADPSSATTRDLVGIDARGAIAAGNTSGRSWGLYSQAEVEATADGYAVGHEIDVRNSATADQSAMATTTSKYGLHVVANGTAGTQNVTAAIYLDSTGSVGFWKGLYSSQASIAVGGNFLELATDKFVVARTGDVTIGGNVTVTAATGTPTLAVSNTAASGVSALTVSGRTAASAAITGRITIGALGSVQFGSSTSHPVIFQYGGVEAWRIVTNATTQFTEGHNFLFGTTTGTKLGTVGGASGQKIGFFNATPIVQPLLATGAGATVDNVITALQNLGLVRQT